MPGCYIPRAFTVHLLHSGFPDTVLESSSVLPTQALLFRAPDGWVRAIRGLGGVTALDSPCSLKVALLVDVRLRTL